MLIDGKTEIYGIFGNPVEHSFSPILQNYLFSEYKLNAAYLAYNVMPQDLKSATNGALSLGIKGFNVTLPHKQSIMPFLSECDEISQRISAVNTVKYCDNKFFGYNTDFFGLKRTFELNDINVRDKNALVIGAGGAAFCACDLLAELSCKKIFLYNRTLENSILLSNQLRVNHNIEVEIFESENELLNLTGEIILQTSSVGLNSNDSPLKNENIFSNFKSAVDVIYIPFETAFIKKAKANDLRIVNGFDMLIYQGIRSFEIWTGLSIDDDKALQIRDTMKEKFLL